MKKEKVGHRYGETLDTYSKKELIEMLSKVLVERKCGAAFGIKEESEPKSIATYCGVPLHQQSKERLIDIVIKECKSGLLGGTDMERKDQHIKALKERIEILTKERDEYYQALKRRQSRTGFRRLRYWLSDLIRPIDQQGIQLP